MSVIGPRWTCSYPEDEEWLTHEPENYPLGEEEE
jgi:hypothetical protein